MLLPQLVAIFVESVRVMGFFAILIGVLLVLASVLGVKGADGYVKGGFLIFAGNFAARLGA